MELKKYRNKRKRCRYCQYFRVVTRGIDDVEVFACVAKRIVLGVRELPGYRGWCCRVFKQDEEVEEWN